MATVDRNGNVRLSQRDKEELSKALESILRTQPPMVWFSPGPPRSERHYREDGTEIEMPSPAASSTEGRV